MDEHELLRQYRFDRSERPFRAIVERYVDLVFAAARRQLFGDAHLAEDVTQAVFAILARRADSVSADRPLSAWLLTTTAYAAANARRAKATRQTHERKAADMARSILEHDQRTGDDRSDWSDLAPLLDEGIHRLKSAERDALLMKYFERKTLAEVGEKLGITEAAAAKRVSRAVEHLRDFFRRRGVVVSSVALAGVLVTNSVEAAPAALSTTAAAGALNASAATASAASITNGALLAMAHAKTQSALIAAAILLLLGGGGAVAYHALKPAAPAATATAAPVQSNAVVAAGGMVRVPSPWEFTFPDGSAVEIIALNDSPNSPQAKWWGPDGSPTTRPQFGNTRGRIGNSAGARPIQFILRHTGPGARGNANVGVMFDGTSYASAMNQNEIGGVRWISYIVAIPPDELAARLDLLLAVGGYRQVEQLNVEALPVGVSRPRPAKPTNGMFVETISEDGGMTTFTLAPENPRPSGPWDVQFLALANGKELPPSMVRNDSGSNGSYEYMFAAEKDAITTLVRRARPFQTGHIQGIALHPVRATTAPASESKARP